MMSGGSQGAGQGGSHGRDQSAVPSSIVITLPITTTDTRGSTRQYWCLQTEASNEGLNEGFIITEKAPTRAFSWLKVPTSAFTFNTLLRLNAKQTLTHVSRREIGLPTQRSLGTAGWLVVSLVS